jgi:hypothetical protein
MLIHFEECESLDECVKLQNDQVLIEGLLEQFEISIDTSIISDSFLQSNSEFQTEDTQEKFSSIDFDHNRVQSLNIWTVRRSLQIKKFHLIICYASNEIGKIYSSRIIIPSELERGKGYLVKVELERLRDPQIIEGDIVKLLFYFNNILYNESAYKLNTKLPLKSCGIDTSIKNQIQNDLVSIYDNNENHKKYKYTRVVELRFFKIIADCAHNYSLELFVNNIDYFNAKPPLYTKPNNPKLFYNMNILSPIGPSFIETSGNN